MPWKETNVFVKFQYPINYRKRFVSNRRFIQFQGKRYFVGNPFGGYNIGAQITSTGQLDVWFEDSLMGYFDKDTWLLIPEKKYTLIKRKKSKMLPADDSIMRSIIAEAML